MSITTKVILKDGKRYPSIVAFCAAFDLPYQKVVGRLNRDWTAEQCIDPTLKTDHWKHKTDYTKTRRYSLEALEKKRIKNHGRWVTRATKKHGDKFSYKNTLIDFKTAKKGKVKIRCLDHSYDFYEIPDRHITSKNGGCERCWKIQVSEDSIIRQEPNFIAWFKATLAFRLEVRSEFKGWGVPIVLYCLEHKTINTTTTPASLKYRDAWGCKLCEKESKQKAIRLNLEEVKDKIWAMDKLPANITIVDVIFDETVDASRIGYSCSYEDHGFRPRVELNHFKRSRLVCDLCTIKHGGRVQARYLDLLEKGEVGDPAVIGVMEVEVESTSGLKVGVTTRSLEERYGYALKTILFKLESTELHVYFLENKVKRQFADFRDYAIQARGVRGELKGGKRWGGDTEIFQQEKRQEIIDYLGVIVGDIQSNKISELEYKKEADYFISLDFEPRDVSREKDMSNQPIAIIGIHPETNEIQYRLDSMSEAVNLGFRNVRSIIHDTDGRKICGGLRWFIANDFDPDNIPLMPDKKSRQKPVRCIETGEVFRTTALAEKIMRSPKHLVQASKITSVCRGNRRKSGGYSWEYLGPREKS